MVYIRHNYTFMSDMYGFSGFKNEVINLHKKLDTQVFEVVSLKRKFELFCRKYIHV